MNWGLARDEIVVSVMFETTTAAHLREERAAVRLFAGEPRLT
jgi:hypothetical protein